MKTNEALGSFSRFKTSVEQATDYIENFDILETINNVGNDEIPLVDGRVPASALAKVKAGKRVAIDVTYKRTGSNEIKSTSSVLKVVP